MTSPSTMLAEYRHSLLVEEQHAKSLKRDRDVNESYEGQVVNGMLEGVEFDEECDTCGYLDSECICNRFVRAL